MDEELVLKRFGEKFQINDKEMSEITSSFTQYILFRREKNRIAGYCTGCKQRLELESYRDKVKHREQWNCPKCRANIRFYMGGKVPTSRHREKRNFVVLRAIKGELYMRCFEVRQWFEKRSSEANDGISEYDTDYTFRETRLYWCGKGEAAEWEPTWRGDYRKFKGLHEPRFDTAMIPDNSYAVIGLKQIKKTCLRYCSYETAPNWSFSPFVVFLCESAKYPAYEKLIKAGFGQLVKSKFFHSGIRFNHKGSTPQQILKLNAVEMKYLQGCTADTYKNYLLFRDNINISGSMEQRLEIFGRVGHCLDDIIRIADKTGLSHTKVINYIDRQTENRAVARTIFIRDWQDYLDQCEQLAYDTTDEGICKPKDFYKMHGRLNNIINAKRIAIDRTKLRKSNKVRAGFEYVGEEYSVLAPKSVDEIITEGRELDHCVGGYAQRHIDGALSIMFLRKNDEPDKPFYTIEVTNEGKIRQCRGYANNVNEPKPDSIKRFEEEYQKHLDGVMAERAKRKKPIKKTELKIGA